MSSRLSIAFATAGLAIAGLAWPGVGTAASAPKTAANGAAELLECSRGKQAKDRRLLVRGSMTQIPGGTRMVMRLHLREKVGTEPWRGAHAPGINLPREARPGVTEFAYRQRVLALKKGASYRISITFRWYDADGREIEHQIAESPICRQPGKLPNPKIRDSIKVADGPTPDTRRYVVRIGNTGRVGVGKVLLRLSVDGAEVDTRRIGKLAAGQRRSVGFVGPVCRGEVVALLDPGNLIAEVSERDNLMRTPCDLLEPLPPA